jgi:NAD(P)-dependent dehydrogenase (short-subunit alcohol dehydrogenase family)
MGYFEGKKVFITGGSQGIGRATALALAKQGASVVVCARGQAGLDETLAALRAVDGGGAHAAVAADVTDAAALGRAAEQAIAALGGLDVLICCCGFSIAGTVVDTSEATFRRLLDVNLFGQVNAYRAVHDHFAAQGRGDIVFMSSMLATFSVWGYGAYSASKFAVTGFAQSVRQEMMMYGVRVKLFFPPTTDTPGFAKENEGKPELLHELETGSALNVLHKPDKVAQALLAWLPTNRFFGMATWDSRLQWFLTRHFPEIALRLADSELRGAQKRLEKKRATARPPAG